MAMPLYKNMKHIEFDIRYWDFGIFFTFRIPFSMENYQTVISMPGSANIKLLK